MVFDLVQSVSRREEPECKRGFGKTWPHFPVPAIMVDHVVVLDGAKHGQTELSLGQDQFEIRV